MRKLFRFIFFAVTLSVFVLISCDKEDEIDRNIAVTGLSLDRHSVSIYEGDTLRLTASITPLNATAKPTIWWSSDDPSVATVEDGIVTATGKGVTNIVAATEDGKFSDTCEVVCKDLPKITLNRHSISLYIADANYDGDVFTLKATITPNDETLSLYWSSDDPSVATVEDGKVTAIGKGVTKIVAATEDGNISDTCEVVCKEAGPLSATINSSLPIGKLTFLTYNLGADYRMTLEDQIAYQPEYDFDIRVFGGLYQWGRQTDGHQQRDSDTTSVVSSTSTPDHEYFILGNDKSIYDWLYPSNRDLWDSIKTPNDPCPEGFRVPTVEEFSSVISSNVWEWTGNGFKVSADGGSTFTLFLPAAGMRNGIQKGALMFAGTDCFYWTVDPHVAIGSYSIRLYMQNEYPYCNIQSSIRSNALSVRCVKEHE